MLFKLYFKLAESSAKSKSYEAAVDAILGAEKIIYAMYEEAHYEKIWLLYYRAMVF